jgi:hypothetical protein
MADIHAGGGSDNLCTPQAENAYAYSDRVYCGRDKLRVD